MENLEKTVIISKAVPVLKEDKSIRLCADCRVIVNPFLKDKLYPMPVVEDLFDVLQGGKLFSKLDLRSAYNQFELEDESRRLLTWSTYKGIHHANRFAFGTIPACAIFKEVLE